MQLCNIAEIEKEEFPAFATLWQGNLHKVAAPYFLLHGSAVQRRLDILRMLGCRAIALPSTEQIVQYIILIYQCSLKLSSSTQL